MNWKLAKASIVPAEINREGFMGKSDLELSVIKYAWHMSVLKLTKFIVISFLFHTSKSFTWSLSLSSTQMEKNHHIENITLWFVSTLGIQR